MAGVPLGAQQVLVVRSLPGALQIQPAELGIVSRAPGVAGHSLAVKLDIEIS
jgi:hypothetical protein